MDKPITTLFMLMSVDGKISTGATDSFDMDQDLPRIPGVREGLHQYYDAEQETDLWSLNTGRVVAKIGANTSEPPKKTPVSFAILDNTHLTARGVRWLCAKTRMLVLITSNPNHPAFDVDEENLHVLYQEEASLPDALARLKTDFGCERLTIQSGGTLNGVFLRENLFDYVDAVVAPVYGGRKEHPHAHRRKLSCGRGRSVRARCARARGLYGTGRLLPATSLQGCRVTPSDTDGCSHVAFDRIGASRPSRGGSRMARQAGKKRMTLSEHLALRAQAAEESKAREEARMHSIQRLKELDAQVLCTCPACVKLRQMKGSDR